MQNPDRRFLYLNSEEYEQRCLRRLQEELDINAEGAEVILQMRNQLLELQARIQELETELSSHYGNQRKRISGYREIYYEATWWEVQDQD